MAISALGTRPNRPVAAPAPFPLLLPTDLSLALCRIKVPRHRGRGGRTEAQRAAARPRAIDGRCRHVSLALPAHNMPADPTTVRELRSLATCLPQCRLHGATAERYPLTGIALHTDQVRPGSLFACLSGGREDGHLWAGVAAKRGATALLVERFLPDYATLPQIEVPDSRVAVAHGARAFFGFPDRRLLMLAVTGTNGKTTTAFMVHAAFAAAGMPLGIIGTVCYRLGDKHLPAPLTTPDPVSLYALLAEATAQGLRGMALEASSHALSQGRLEGVEVDCAVFTNLTRDHLDYHGNVMAYFAAKRRLFAPRAGGKPYRATAVICTDRPAGRLLTRLVRGHRSVITYGLQPGADVQGRVETGTAPDSATLLVRGCLGSGAIPLPFPGLHNAQNALAATTVALLHGVPFAAAAEGLRTMPPVPGRLEAVDEGQDFAVIVDFAHNPHGLRCALDAARQRCTGRLILVFGCKGEDGDEAKRVQMGAIAGRLADAVVLTTDDPYGEAPAQIAARVTDGLRSVGAKFRGEPDRETAIRTAITEARAGDVVLVAGRGHEIRQPWGGNTRPLDDREACRQALQDLRAARRADLFTTAATLHG